MDSTRRSTGRVRSPSSVAVFASRDRLVVASCIFLVTALAWAYLVRLDHSMSSAGSAMDGMRMEGSWDPANLLFTFVMWSVMMVGMMTAAAAPVILLFSEMQRSRGEASGQTGIFFGVGHLIVWVGFSAVAAIAQWTLHEGAWMSSGMTVTSERLAGIILMVAGAYQLSPLKGACLKRCQSPLGFLLTSWRAGSKGALQMGLRHGMFCLGCCWALMFVLFVVGVMDLRWVAALTVFILLEKFGPMGARVARAGGVLMIGFGLFSLVRPPP